MLVITLIQSTLVSLNPQRIFPIPARSSIVMHDEPLPGYPAMGLFNKRVLAISGSLSNGERFNRLFFRHYQPDARLTGAITGCGCAVVAGDGHFGLPVYATRKTGSLRWPVDASRRWPQPVGRLKRLRARSTLSRTMQSSTWSLIRPMACMKA